MENIALHLKLVRRVMVTSLAYVAWHHINVAHISPRSYLSLDKEMITRAPMFNLKSNLNLNQELLDRVYHDYHCNTDNALVY